MPNCSCRWFAGAFGLDLFHASLNFRRIRESSRIESPVKHGTTLTCTESASTYGPMVVVAFIQPDLEMVRVQVFSVTVQLLLIPPVPLSDLQVQLPSVQLIEALTDAVKVTDCAPAMLTGLAVTLNCGGAIAITGPRTVPNVTLPLEATMLLTSTCPRSRTTTRHVFCRVQLPTMVDVFVLVSDTQVQNPPT